MSKARWLWAMLLMLAVPSVGVAQQQGTIQGTVIDATNLQPLSGAQVSVVGTGRGSLTNQQGRFTILNVPAGAHTVRVSMLGYSQIERSATVTPASAATVDFTLQQTALALEGVVVTALGVERQSRALGVAAQQITDESLSAVEPNIVNALSGRVSGVHVTNAGPQGGSSRVVIRGASSIQGNNQPLFVVDGVPIDNSGPRMRGYGGYDYGNTVQDIATENIESLTVLKGPNAAALYGSRAANGAILITTKRGRGVGGQITASQLISFERPFRLPDYQNEFGQGLFGRFSFVDGRGGGVWDYYDESWGPALDGRLVAQYNSPLVNGVRQPTPWVARPNNIREMFDPGRTLNTNVAFSVANEDANARVSFGRMQLDGIMPGMSIDQTTVGLAGGLQVASRLRTEATVTYFDRGAGGRPGVGYEASNPMQQAIWFGRQVDVNDLRANWEVRQPAGDPNAGLPYAWNYQYFPNPFYILFGNENYDTRDRLIGQVSAMYDLTPWLNAQVRTGTDWYQDDRRFNYAPDLQGMLLGFDPRLGADNLTIGDKGAFGEWNIGNRETNTDFLLNANPDLNLPFTVSASLGANRRDRVRNQKFGWYPEMIVPGIYSAGNNGGTVDNWDDISRRRINSVYGQTELGYQNYLFVTVTGRNDWSSTLPPANRSYFYPSVSTSLIFSDLISGLQDSPLNFGKLRASWARVGNDTDPYNLRNTYVPSTEFRSFSTFRVPNTLANAELRPETTESWEFGTELGFLDGRLGLDLTYYTANTRDQIMDVQISRAAGYNGMFINAGTVRNSGVEALLNIVPVQTSGLRWETTFNFARNRNTVVELTDGVDGLRLTGGTFWGVEVFARKDEPYGQLMGLKYVRDGQGNIVVGSTGLPLRTAAPEVIGNYTPDWRGGMSNSVSFRGLTLNALLDLQRGGDVYSVTHMFGRYAGVLEETVAGRCKLAAGGGPAATAAQVSNWALADYPVCNAQNGIVVPGVKIVSVVGADTTFATNDIVTNSQNYNRGLYNTHEAHVFDASYVKLREASIGFALPAAFTSRLGIAGMDLQVLGRNLALWTDMPHIDPETAFDASNVQGIEFGQIPSARSIGINFNVRP